MKNKIKNSEDLKSALRPFWKRVGNSLDKKYYSSRKALNSDLWKLIKANNEFRKDISLIRNKFEVPKLKFDDDFEVVFSPRKEEDGSKWLESQPLEKRNQFKKIIQKLILKYHLPFYSTDFLTGHILWNSPFSETPRAWLGYASELLFLHEDELMRLPPTSQEKRMLKDQIRQIFKIKRRPNIKNAETYKSFLETINTYKNNTRRLHTLKTAIKAYKKPHRKKWTDWATGNPNEPSNKLYTYKQLATDIYSTENEKDEIKQANRLKKQKERLKRRLGK